MAVCRLYCRKIITGENGMSIERLDKVVASVTGCTRSQARQIIKQKRVQLDGKTVSDIALKVDTLADKLLVDGKALCYEEFVYFLMNKPKGVLSVSRDKRAKTVLDLLCDQDARADLFCVGRLDKDTTGLLIITNDGDTAHKLMSPKTDTNKTYEVTLDGNVTEQMVKAFAEGVTLVDGTRCKPAVLQATGDNKALLTISEGKYHQVKRMLGTVGLGVVELKRLSIGKLSLPPQLQEGEYIKVSPQTVLDILG